MKKIINGKVYNTATAELIGTWSSPSAVNDFSHFDESLYRKRTGEFFLFGQGGPASRYAVQVEQHGWNIGSKIIPLTWENARDWAEDHLEAEKYEETFGEVAKDDSRVVVTLSLPTSSLELAKRSASQAGISLSAYIDFLIMRKEL